MNATSSFLKLRRLFYLVLPSESTYESLDLVPKYVIEAIPFFLLMLAVEFAILSRKPWKYTGICISDTISSITAGLLSQLPLLFFKSTEVVAYIWVYDNYRIISLPNRSALVWLLGMLGVDFGYYWVHRASHEISLFWSGHQTHHSSQRYNLSTALRQGSLQRYFSWMFYLPMALCLPPTIFVVHIQFNLLYQFWIHTEVIGTLGFLEYFLNTPSHHRVHHGRNRYCIDKNYGGTLIIFDRIFGTFEKENEKVIYGLVHTLETWNPIEAQICHLRYALGQFWANKGIWNKFKGLFYGPGWSVGTPRLGDINDIPVPESPTKFYGKKINNIVVLYCVANFVLCNIGYFLLAAHGKELTFDIRIMVTGLIFVTLVQIGRMLDGITVFYSECIRVVAMAYVVAMWVYN